MEKNFLENSIVCCAGALGYALLELLWRGYTHWTMVVTGGVCFLIIYKTNLKLNKKSILLKSFIGAGVVTSIELIVGSIVNLELKWNVWDYSSQPLNFLGQICALYSLFWFALCFPLSPLCKLIRKQVTNA